MNQPMEDTTLWSIILAGGEGVRLRALVQRWLGHHKPKQYCTFVGTRSMLQHTLDRADQLSAADRKVTVIARSHRWAARPQLRARPGTVVLQPSDRGTAAAVFLALSHIRAADPSATVVLYPSDHFVYPESRFEEVVRTAVLAARQSQPRLFLLGVPPDSLEPEYGWIHPGTHLGWIDGRQLRGVKAFFEKPSLGQCRAAMEAGALWNTLILAAKAENLWALGHQCVPEMMELFERYQRAIGSSEEGTVLEAIYAAMPRRNFSSDLLECVPAHIAVIELSRVLWCDWGQPQRIVETLRRIGKRPAFPLTHLIGDDLRRHQITTEASGRMKARI